MDGTPALKKAIQAKFSRENDLSYELDQISVGTGGKQVLYNAFMATINKGDEVIIPAPYWVSYPDIVLLAGGKPKIIKCDEKNNFKLTPEKLTKAVSKKTKWIIINSPSNPTGSGYTKDEIMALSKILIKYKNLYILSDDIYEHITYDGFKFFTIAQIEKLKSRTLTMNGVSKSYSMTGWRIGYAAGPKEIIKAMAKIQSQSTSNPTSISQAAAVEALNGSQDFILKIKQQLSPQSALFRHAVRLAVVFAIGYAISLLPFAQNGYWILLTSLFVCQITYFATKSRLKLRTIGTLLGVLLGVPILYFVPSVEGQLIITVICGVYFFYLRQKKYALATVMATLMVLLIFNL